MLAIRLQRTGRKGHAQFRVVVQEARLSPTSERVVARLGNYDPHTKQVSLVKDKAEFYLQHGAQPSDRVALLLKQEGIKLPGWVKLEGKREGKIRNPEKLRKNRPAGTEPAPKAEESEPAEEVAEPESAQEATTDKAKTNDQAEPKAEESSSPEATEATAESQAESASSEEQETTESTDSAKDTAEPKEQAEDASSEAKKDKKSDKSDTETQKPKD